MSGVLAMLLGLSASLFWGSSDFLGGLEARFRSIWSVAGISQCSGLLLAALLLLGSGHLPSSPSSALAATLGGVAAGVAIVLYYAALSLGTMSVVASLVASSTLVPVLVGLALGEKPDLLAQAGMALVIGGVALSYRTASQDRTKSSMRCIMLALAAACCFGVMKVGLSVGCEDGVCWSVFEARLGSAAAILAYIVARRPTIRVSFRAMPALVGVGVLGVVGNIAFAAASTLGYLSVGAVLSSLSPLTVAALAGVGLRERPTSAQIAGAAVVLVGVVILAAG